MVKFTPQERKLVEQLLSTYDSNRHLIEQFRDQVVGALQTSKSLTQNVHSVKSRMKNRDHLRDKLFRKIEEHKRDAKVFRVTPSNLLKKVTDLAGVRILHLHTQQIRDIDSALRDIFTEQRFDLVEKPFARTWDDESRAFFKSCGIRPQRSPSMYTSVHYVVGSASRTTVTCEIQVRTLMEEVWGEVDHSMNYPHKSGSIPCQEQLKVLARVTSSATRLVDSIFLTAADHKSRSVLKTSPASKRKSNPH